MANSHMLFNIYGVLSSQKTNTVHFDMNTYFDLPLKATNMMAKIEDQNNKTVF